MADLILPNTKAEKELIQKGLGIPEDRMRVVPNGVELRFADASPELFHTTYGLKDFVLFAGQASAPRKNVRTLVKAVHTLDCEVVIIGDPGNDTYGQEIRESALGCDHIHFLDTMEHDAELLASAYAACHTFILPSLYETPGIAALEAGLAGANIVITPHGGSREYFGEQAIYIDPESESSIRKGIGESLSKDKTNTLSTHIREHFSWDRIVRLSLDHYQELLSQ